MTTEQLATILVGTINIDTVFSLKQEIQLYMVMYIACFMFITLTLGMLGGTDVKTEALIGPAKYQHYTS